MNVKINEIKENRIYIKDVAIIDVTPLLDIKPYVPEFDHRDAKGIGWLDKNISKLIKSRDDGRFT